MFTSVCTLDVFVLCERKMATEGSGHQVPKTTVTDRLKLYASRHSSSTLLSTGIEEVLQQLLQYHESFDSDVQLNTEHKSSLMRLRMKHLIISSSFSINGKHRIISSILTSAVKLFLSRGDLNFGTMCTRIIKVYLCGCEYVELVKCSRERRRRRDHRIKTEQPYIVL